MQLFQDVRLNPKLEYIAFTDSRQGTAISAKTFNIAVERTVCREKAVRLLAAKQDSGMLKTIMNMSAVASLPDASRKALMEELAKQSNVLDEGITLEKMADEIYESHIFGHIAGKNEDKAAYKAALLRGFIGRKPLYETSGESMGLFTLVYPALKDIRRPNSLVDYCDAHGVTMTDGDWQDYLKVILDYFVRMGNHIQPLIDGERKYVRDANLSTPIAGPDDLRKGVTHWPSLREEKGQYSGQQSRIILLLCAALGVDSLDKLKSSSIALKGFFKDAWQTLVDKKGISVNSPFVFPKNCPISDSPPRKLVSEENLMCFRN